MPDNPLTPEELDELDRLEREATAKSFDAAAEGKIVEAVHVYREAVLLVTRRNLLRRLLDEVRQHRNEREANARS